MSTGGVFDDGVTDVFIHSVPKGEMSSVNLEGFREVLLEWSARVREHCYRITWAGRVPHRLTRPGRSGATRLRRR
jgi:hypothetical protein